MTDPTYPAENAGDAVGADLGPGAPDPDDERAEPEEFQSPLSVAGPTPGGESYGEEAPSDENPAADPGPGFAV